MSYINVTWQGGGGPVPPRSQHHLMSFSFFATRSWRKMYAPIMGDYVATTAQPDIAQIYFPWDIEVKKIMMKPIVNTNKSDNAVVALCAPDPVFDLSITIPKQSVAQQIIEMSHKISHPVPVQWEITSAYSGQTPPQLMVVGWIYYEILE